MIEMNILLVNVPSRMGAGGFMVPLGPLYVGGIIERCGHHARIYDPYLEDPALQDFDSHRFDKVDKIIEEYKPAVIGYGGIATSYGRTKSLSLHVSKKHPHIIQIAGGALASTYELLLTKTGVKTVFHGESEVSLPIFLERLKQGKPFDDIPGTSHASGENVIRNEPAEQIEDLDTIPLPPYHLVDVLRYLHPINDYLISYKNALASNPFYADLIKKIGTKTHFLPMVTSRGCTHKCLFCYRHVRGVRRHSVDYVIKHIKYLQQNFGIAGFQFCDELFNSSQEWIMQLCDAIERNNLDIFYLVAGVRADKIDEIMLRRLKATGCIEVDYGQESGSDIILKEYRKGVSAQRNREVTLLTKAVGLNCPVQLVIGSPGETNATIRETIRFLKDADAFSHSLNYLIPLPETPIWQYVKQNNLIPDVESYLDKVAEAGGTALVNLTKCSDRVWRNWGRKISSEMKLYYYKKTGSKLYWYYYLREFLFDTMLNLIPYGIVKYIPKPLKVIAIRLMGSRSIK